MELTHAIRQYIAGRCAAKLEPLDKELVKAEKNMEADELAVFRLDWQQRKQELESKFAAAVWLTDAARRAPQISLVSHALKYSHSDAKGTSLMLTPEEKPYSRLSSHHLKAPKADVVGNAAVLDVANLLLLEAGGKRLLDFVAEGDSSPLDTLGDQAAVQGWVSGFKEALHSGDPASHTLAKQSYFPVDDSVGYHLLAPLSASSLHHAVYQRIQASRFSEASKAAREARKKSVFWESGTRDYPNLALQTFGGTKPQNVSLLNSQRGGKLYLLNSQPPEWQTQAKPPESSERFWQQYLWRIHKQIRGLKSFLEWVDQRNLNNIDIRYERARRVASMVDELHQFAASVQQLPSGWSGGGESNISLHEACWLDPKRTDETFQYEREGKEWCESVAKTFGRVLSKAMTTNKLLMADDETRHFRQQIRVESKRLMMDLEEWT